MEFIAILLLAPFFWPTAETTVDNRVHSEETIVTEARAETRAGSRPVIERLEGQYVIRPPHDLSLTMVVLERKGESGHVRSPASSRPDLAMIRTIEVIVSAP